MHSTTGSRGTMAQASPMIVLASQGARGPCSAMFVVTEADAAAIRAAFHEEGELSAIIELRQRFRGITDHAQARAGVRTIAGWQPPPRRCARWCRCIPARDAGAALAASKGRRAAYPKRTQGGDHQPRRHLLRALPCLLMATCEKAVSVRPPVHQSFCPLSRADARIDGQIRRGRSGVVLRTGAPYGAEHSVGLFGRC